MVEGAGVTPRGGQGTPKGLGVEGAAGGSPARGVWGVKRGRGAYPDPGGCTDARGPGIGGGSRWWMC